MKPFGQLEAVAVVIVDTDLLDVVAIAGRLATVIAAGPANAALHRPIGYYERPAAAAAAPNWLR